MIASYIDGTPWVLVSYLAESYILSDLEELLFVLFGILVVVMIAAFVIISLVVRRIPTETLLWRSLQRAPTR